MAITPIPPSITSNTSNAPTLTLETTKTLTNSLTPVVKVFKNVNADGGGYNGVLDTGNNSIIKQIVIKVTGAVNFASEKLTIDGFDIPLIKTAVDRQFPTGGSLTNGSSYSVSQIGLVTTVTLKKLNLLTLGDTNQANTLMESILYKNTNPTPTDGNRSIAIASMTDGGAVGTSNNGFLGQNYTAFNPSLMTSTVTLDRTAPNAPVLNVAENDGVGVTNAEGQDGTSVVVSLVGTGAREGDVITMTVKDLAPIKYTLLSADIDSDSLSMAISSATLQSLGSGIVPVTVTITDAAQNTSVVSAASMNLVNVNSAPSGMNNTVTISEDNSRTFTASDFGFSDVASNFFYGDGGANTLSAVIITALPTVGTLTLNNVNVIQNQRIPVEQLADLKYTPGPNGNGQNYASIGFKVQDNGGVANGGSDTSTANTLTINVTPVNDAPVNTVPNTQSATTATVKVITGLSIADIDADMADMTITLAVDHGTIAVATTGTSITLSNNGTGSVTLTGSKTNLNALLASPNGVTYTSASGYVGTDTLTMTTSDNGNTGSGGTLTDQDKLDILVVSPNHAPVLADTSLSFASVLQGASISVPANGNTTAGVLVSSLLGGGTDVDTSALKGMVITGVDTVNGTLYYTTNSGSTWTKVIATLSESNALLIGGDSTQRIAYVPNTSSGFATNAITFHAWDQTSGTQGSLVNLTTLGTGGATAFSTATDTVSQTVTTSSVVLTNSINGEASGDHSGAVISNAGDVNGDGYDDVLIGAPHVTLNGNLYTGKTYVVFGSTNDVMPLNLSSLTAGTSAGGFVINGATGNNSGISVSAAGDLNGDGLADIFVGAPRNGAGASYVVYGKASTTAVELSSLGAGGVVINGQYSGDQAGSYVSSVGDINGDGIADLMMGANAADPSSGTNAGRVFVAFGSTANTTINMGNLASGIGGFVIDGPAANEQLVSTSNVGDFNGDNLADILVSASLANNAMGRTYLVFGKSTGTSVSTASLGTNGLSISGEASNNYSGASISNAGDVNGDGLADLIIGAPYADMSSAAPAYDEGRAYVVFGTTSTASINLANIKAGVGGFAIQTRAISENLGSSVSYAGDINGDGLADVLVHANKANSWAGRTYVVYGKTGSAVVEASNLMAGNGGFVINGQAASDTYNGNWSSATNVSYAGDLNGDGYDDLLVSALLADPVVGGSTKTDAGETYVIYGGPQFSSGNVALGTGTAVDENVLGTSGNDTLVGNGGVDRFNAGKGNDTIVLQASDVTNLASKVVGNVKAMVDGGTGFDTLQVASSGVNLDLTAISNVGAMTNEGTSRINSIERINLGTDTTANTLSLAVNDVNDMAGFNQIHTGTASADGNIWNNVTGSALSNITKYHQLVVDGTNSDNLVFSPDKGYWFNAGTVSNGSSNYDVYQNLGTNSQVLVQSGVVVTNNDPNLAPVFSSTNATAAAGFLPVVGGTPIWNRTTSYGISSLGGITTNITATGDSTPTNSYGTGSSTFMWIGDQQRTETLSVSFDKPVYQVKIEFSALNNDGTNKDTLSFQVNGANLVLSSANFSSSETSVSGNTITGNGGGVYSITSSTAINSLSTTDTISGGPSGVGIAIQYSSAPLQVSGGVAISSLMPAATDADGSVVGYAITSAATETGADTTPGSWQYFNGSTWTSLASASVSQAVYLAASTLVRWNDNDMGYTALSAVAVDNTVVATLGQALNVMTRGGATAYSADVATLPAASVSNSGVSFALASDTGTSASDFITSNGTMNVSLSVSSNTWSYSTDSGTTWATGSGTSFVLGAGSYAANAVQVRENGSGIQTVAKFANALTVDTAAPTVAVTMSDVALALGEKSTVTFQFSENVANFDINDVAIKNSTGGVGAGGLSALTKVSDSKWTAVYTPTTEANTTGNQIVVALNGYNDVAGNNGVSGLATFNVDTRFSSSLTAGFYGTTSSSSSANSSVTTNAVIVDYWNPAWQGDTIKTYKNGSQIDVFTISGATNSKSLGNLTASPGDTFYSTITHNGTTYNLFNMIKVNPGTAGLTRYDSPLVLDLNGDGIQTVDMAQGTTFDLQATGTAQATGWVNAHDGLLAMDLNNDGKINSGAELFGSSTLLDNGQKAANGWAALAQYDSNGDSQIDTQDAAFDALKVWQDANGNGVTDAGELRSLKDVGATSINLGHDNTVTQQNGNLLQGFSSYTTADGTTHEVVDAWFQTVTTATSVSGNGASEEGDVRSLADTGIALMNLNSDGVQTIPAAGVTEAGRSTAELSNGLSMLVADVAFDYVSTAPEFVLTGLVI